MKSKFLSVSCNDPVVGGWNMQKRLFVGIALVTVMFASAVFAAEKEDDGPVKEQRKSRETPAKQAGGEEVVLGAWYFGGWSFTADATGHTWHIGPGLTEWKPSRKPVWGWRSDSLEIMKTQIDYAADYGLSFWGFVWFEESLLAQRGGDMPLLNKELEIFLAAPNRHKLKFFLLCTDPVSPSNWDKICDASIKFLKEDNYLRIDNKPVIVFFEMDAFLKNYGNVYADVNAALQKYRRKAREAGIGEILVGARTWPVPEVRDYQKRFVESGFDFLTSYQYEGYGGVREKSKTSQENDYSVMMKYDIQALDDVTREKTLPFIPTVGVGFDVRPWEKCHGVDKGLGHPLEYYTGNTSEKIAEHVDQGIQWIKANPDKILARMLIIYAWNEYGEGGWLVPTESEGNARLEAIKKVAERAAAMPVRESGKNNHGR
jgi:hypothetical protein